ncbi:MAG TPA: hypothetical protein VHU91_01605 [Mycobacteriales bacterium]|jgi:hypothetical protein|nr:hypothetical protein [Mycobacteriales bacterium]
MPNVIVRDVAVDDVATLKRAAAAGGISLQKYLAQELHDEASRLRRQEAIDRMRARMKGRSSASFTEIAESMSAIQLKQDEQKGIHKHDSD